MRGRECDTIYWGAARQTAAQYWKTHTGSRRGGEANMRHGSATIIQENAGALRVAAASARISTQPGTALQIYENSQGGEKDIKLIKKVLSSGHKSVIEHQSFSIAFDNVSVFVEQFMIEFRLASFTVKSRRYVDFSQAGFVVPDSLPDRLLPAYNLRMVQLFDLYSALLGEGIPREDARFVLPYCFRSNFFVSLNARELIHVICSMIYGRGARFAEIRCLGESLAKQFDELYPGVLEAEGKRYAGCLEERLPEEFAAGEAVRIQPTLMEATENAEHTLEMAMRLSGRFQAEEGGYLTAKNLLSLVRDARARELEMINYTFRVENASLACVTHFSRHRMQTLLLPCVAEGLAGGCYVLPESIAARPELRDRYTEAFRTQAAIATNMLREGMRAEDAAYFAMAGHTIDFLMAMNGRELLHFMKLRTCSRAQWEIRDAAGSMLEQLRDHEPMIFRAYGPSCAVTGVCPEGKLSCGQPKKLDIAI